MFIAALFKFAKNGKQLRWLLIEDKQIVVHHSMDYYSVIKINEAWGVIGIVNYFDLIL